MSNEIYKETVTKIGKAFNELPDDFARIEVLCSLIGIMKSRVKNDMLNGWLEEAHSCFKSCVNLWKINDL